MKDKNFKSLLTLLFLILSWTNSCAISPNFINNGIFEDNAGYFADIFGRYMCRGNKNNFSSENYLINNDAVTLPSQADLIFFKQSYFRSGKSSFFLNINLLSGRYGQYTDLDNKAVVLAFSYPLLTDTSLGIEASWNEISDNGPIDFYSLKHIYNIFVKYSIDKLGLVLRYEISGSENFTRNFSFFGSWKPLDHMEIGVMGGKVSEFSDPESYLNSIFLKREISFTTVFRTRIQEYLGILFYYRTRESHSPDMEFTMDVYERFFFQFYLSDTRENKRLLIKIPLYKNYFLVAGPEFYDRYFISLSLLEKGEKHLFILGFKNTIKLDLKRNLSFFVKYRYLI
ncbi:hypothetical protein KAR04_05215 [Candidatus Calescamantes bacterium]|nr:hypothetical protein [Candidatus Calescamantes bacterium]MCK5599489.1 hypothetical protein [bacterium]